MEITDLETIALSCSVPEELQPRAGGLVFPASRRVKVDMLILKVITDEGIVGFGEPSPYAGVQNLKRAAEDLESWIVGKDPTKPDVLTRPHSWYQRTLQGGAHEFVRAGLNMACWDILGKASGQPVHAMLGGKQTDQLDVYASGGNNWEFVRKPERLVEEAESYLDEGFTAFKFRIGNDERFVEAVRLLAETVGDEMELIVEGNMRFPTVTAAIKMGKRLAEIEPYWFEEPISGSNRAGYRELRRALPEIPITGGEIMKDANEIKPWIDSHAYDIVQPDANIMGISGVKRVAELAHLEGLLCTPHNWHNAITRAANVQVAATIPNCDLLELQKTWFAGCPTFRKEIVKQPIKAEDGSVSVPDRPGLGVELEESVLDAYSYEEGPVTTSWDDHPFQ